MQVSQKRTLADLRDHQYFDLSVLADQAGVDLSVIRRMLNREPVYRYQAELVFVALSDETGVSYTLESIDVLLFPEEENEHH